MAEPVAPAPTTSPTSSSLGPVDSPEAPESSTPPGPSESRAPLSASREKTPLVLKFPQWLEEGVRWADDFLGGTRTIPGFHQRSLLAFLLPIPVFFFVLYGSAGLASMQGFRSRGVLGPALLVTAIFLQWLYFKQTYFRRAMTWVHGGLIVALSAVSLWMGAETEASHGLYRNSYAVFAILLMLIAGGIQVFRTFNLYDGELDALASGMDVDDVLARPRAMVWRGSDFVRALVVSVLRTPLHVLTPVALFMVFVDQRYFVWWAVGLVALLSLLLITAGNYDPARDAFVRLVGKAFLSGGALVVTLALMVVAGTRVWKLDYITTLLDTSSVMTIASYTFSTYALIWLYDFWMHQAGIETLNGLECLKRDGELDVWRHGGGRVTLVDLKDPSRRGIFEPARLLKRIATTSNDKARLRPFATRIRNGLTMISTGFTILLVLVPIGVGLVSKSRPQAPALDVPLSSKVPVSGALPVPFDLGTTLAQAGQDEPVLMLAASGGGTRAALYATGVLHGIQRLGKVGRVVLASGASGGSAAIAYFATFQGELLGGDEAAWQRMADTLSQPFIDDVLRGAGELRILGATRNGALLAESFERRYLSGSAREPESLRLGTNPNLGVIFSFGMSGETQQDGGWSTSDAGSRVRAGELIAMTNVAASSEEDALSTIRAPYVPLLDAAAVSANFPPVFSNAAVDLSEGRRYWVTDGGAVENRGVLPLLAELRAALRSLAGKKKALPDIRVIVADASAFDPKYTSDRGIGAKFGAAEKVADMLIRELLASANDAYAAVAGRRGVTLVSLPMPSALRRAGTFGTHWKMPNTIPYLPPGAEEPIDLDDCTTKALIDATFAPDFTARFPKDAACDWAATPEQLEAGLREAPTDPTPWETLQTGVN